MNIVAILENTAQKFSAKPAIIFKDRPITFAQLKDFSFKLANCLLSLRIKKGDKIAIYLPSSPEYVYSYLAIWSIGATIVPLDFMLTEEELVACISHSEAKILIARPKSNISLPGLKEKCPALKEIITCQEKTEGFLSLEELLRKSTAQLPPREIPDKDYACIFYTSGTTGRPKGVLCNYLQVEAPAKAMAYFVNLSDKDTALCALAFSHLGGLVFIQGILFLATTVVLMERFIPLEFLKNIQKYRVNCFWLVPPMYYAMLQLKEFEVFDLSTLEWITVFGAPSSAEQLMRFHKYCPQAKLINGWGMTETQGPSMTNFQDTRKVSSVGLPEPWIEVKIFNEFDQEVAPGEVGEVVVRGRVVTDGYYKDPEATKAAWRHGWFHTGDLGRLDAEGFLYIVGRKKEMIKVGGEIAFEPEIESAIHKHPAIAEVAVVGVEDKLRGEVPKAFVVLKEGNNLSGEELRYFCREHLAHFKIPHYFEIRNSLPKNRAGKIDKETLRVVSGVK